MKRQFGAFVTIAALYRILIQMGVTDDWAQRYLRTLKHGTPDLEQDETYLFQVNLTIGDSAMDKIPFTDVAPPRE